MKNSILILSVLISLLFSSCVSKKIVYTSDIQKEYQFSEEKLKKIQFYTSGKIVLVKANKDGEAKISDGKLLMINKNDIETVIIPRNTKCIVEQVINDNKFLFSFEVGEGKFILFGNNGGDGCYSLMSREWIDGVGTIQYANKNYITQDGNVFLLIGAKKLNKLKAKERTVKGRTI